MEIQYSNHIINKEVLEDLIKELVNLAINAGKSKELEKIFRDLSIVIPKIEEL